MSILRDSLLGNEPQTEFTKLTHFEFIKKVFRMFDLRSLSHSKVQNISTMYLILYYCTINEKTLNFFKRILI